MKINLTVQSHFFSNKLIYNPLQACMGCKYFKSKDTEQL